MVKASPWSRYDTDTDAVVDVSESVPTVDIQNLSASSSLLSGGRGAASYRYNYYDGEKFAGGFGTTSIYYTDYWTLRQRSSQLFKENLYARGVIRRLITNELNTGLTLDSNPEFALIPGMSEDAATEWSEDAERRWKMFAMDPRLCDYKQEQNEGEIQKTIRRESLIDGDILVVQRFDSSVGASRTQLIRGELVRSPLGKDKADNGNIIRHGVELDDKGRHIAYWVNQEETNEFERLPAVVAGRRVAWLVYGTDKRHGQVRGEPLLSLILQSLKDIDRYRDAAQRKALINSFLAMYIKKDQPVLGSRPLTGGAVRKDQITISNDDGAAEPRTLNFDSHLPGIILDELQPGETPQAFGPDGTDLNFAGFESAIINAIAWANEMPAEILQLAFGQSYSASQAAVNEFKMYLNKFRAEFSAAYCTPRYYEWLYNELLVGRMTAPGLLRAWDDPRQYVFVNAWRTADWTGAIKPANDITKQVNGYASMVEHGFITRARAAKELTGTGFLANARALKRENELVQEFNESLGPATVGAEAEPAPSQDVVAPSEDE